jgi:hypothetical protein
MRANGHAIMNRPQVVWFKADDILPMWSVLEPFIRRGLLPGSAYTADEIKTALIGGHMQLWAYGEFEFDCVLVTKCEEDCLLLVLSGTNMVQWIHHLKLVEGWARRCGSTRMLVHGRKGWIRVLRGYNAGGTDENGFHILTKDLSR